MGDVVGGHVSASACGEIVSRTWQQIPDWCPRAKLDAWIVMPDHLHGIVILEPVSLDSEETSLATAVGRFKSKSTKSVRAMGYPAFTWQERFHDRILDSLEALERARDYIRQNPQRWEAKRKKTG